MSQMTAQRLQELFEQHPGKDVLSWTGQCHDCQCEVAVTAEALDDGIHVAGGALYEPTHEQFFLKCDACYEQDPTLKDFQTCEVYSRVVGYLRPVAQWNDGKQAEFEMRKTFDRSVPAA